MRVPRFRFSVRRLMVAVAVLAVLSWVVGREIRFRRLAEYHFLRSSADIACCVVLVTDDGQETALVEGGTGSPTTLARVGWHKALHEKYERAARSPWLPVAPDPSPPE